MSLDIILSTLSATLCSMSVLRNVSSQLPKSPACMQPGMHDSDHNILKRETVAFLWRQDKLVEGAEFEAWRGPLLHLASSEWDRCGQACGMRALYWVLRQ